MGGRAEVQGTAASACGWASMTEDSPLPEQEAGRPGGVCNQVDVQNSPQHTHRALMAAGLAAALPFSFILADTVCTQQWGI